MSSSVLLTPDEWIEVYGDYHDVGYQVGDTCIVDYKDQNGLLYYGVQGLIVDEELASTLKRICVPLSKIAGVLERGADIYMVTMTNWLVLSKQTLINNLGVQTTAIVNQLSGQTGGGGSGGLTTQQYDTIISKLNYINTNVIYTKNAVINYANTIRNDIDGLALDMILDHDMIMTELRTGGSGLVDTLLGGIDSIVTWIGDQITGVVDSFMAVFGDLFTWSDGMLSAIQTSFMAQSANLVDTVTNFTSFISAEMFTGFNLIMEGVSTPLAALGTVADFLQLDFMEFLSSATDFNMSDAEHWVTQFMIALKNTIGIMEDITGEKS